MHDISIWSDVNFFRGAFVGVFCDCFGVWIGVIDLVEDVAFELMCVLSLRVLDVESETVEFVDPVVDPNCVRFCVVFVFFGGLFVWSVFRSLEEVVTRFRLFGVEGEPLIEFRVRVFDTDGETGEFLW